MPRKQPGTHMSEVDTAWRTARARARLDDVRIHDLHYSFLSRTQALGESLPMVEQLPSRSDGDATARLRSSGWRLHPRSAGADHRQHRSGYPVRPSIRVTPPDIGCQIGSRTRARGQYWSAQDTVLLALENAPENRTSGASPKACLSIPQPELAGVEIDMLPSQLLYLGQPAAGQHQEADGRFDQRTSTSSGSVGCLACSPPAAAARWRATAAAIAEVLATVNHMLGRDRGAALRGGVGRLF